VLTAPVVTWAFSRDALSTDRIPLAARENAGHQLGALLLLLGAALLVIGLAVSFAVAQRPPSRRARTIAGRTLLGGIALVPVVVVIAVATSTGGLKGQVSDAWDKLTNPAATTPANTPDRLVATSSVRSRYWKEGWQIYKSSELVGVGAGAYATARTRYRTDRLAVRHAHGYGIQTLADLGLIGVGLSLFTAIAWIFAAVRAIGLRPRDRGLPFDPERIGLATLATVVVIFALHSLIDWTWFVPGNAFVALLCAGWVAGRPALRNRDEVVREPVRWLPPPRLAGAAAVAVLAVALAASWAALQPVRSANADDRAQAAAELGKYDLAAKRARTAAKRNPLSLEPLWLLAFIEDARGNTNAANGYLERAVQRQPANAEAWRRLGRYRLSVRGDTEGAVRAFRAAYFLDPASDEAASDLIEATRALQAKK
jgi:hypothetical protein